MLNTFEDFLKMESMAGTKVISGSGGLNKIIKYFGVLDAPDCIHLVRPNEFVVSTGFVFKDGSVSLLQMIHSLCQKGASGIGLKLRRYIDEIDVAIIEFADINNFPILILPNHISWHDVSLSIINSPFMSTLNEQKQVRDKYLVSLLTSKNAIPLDQNMFEKDRLEILPSYFVAVGKIDCKNLDDLPISVLYSYFQSLEERFNVLAGIHDKDMLFALIPPTAEKNRSNPTCIVNQIHQYLVLILPHCRFFFGVGTAYNSSNLFSSYEEALTALFMGKHSGKTITHYNDLGALRLIGSFVHNLHLQKYIDHYVIPLIEFDNNYHAELLITIKLYYKNNCNTKDCADAMFLHINTVRYRLNQVSEVIGIDLKNTDDLFALYLAIKIYETLFTEVK